MKPEEKPQSPKKRRKLQTRNAKEEEFEVEKILDSRLDKPTGKIEFLVKWRGYAKSANSWEPEDNLGHCGRKILEYREALKSE